jgi:hypothetical protein
MTLRSQRWLVATLALVLWALPATAGLRDTYNQALDAIGDRQWQRAERLLREAIAMRPTEAKRLPFKRMLYPYLPHYFLGVTHAQRGNCRAAIEEFETSLGQGAIIGLDAAAQLQEHRYACQQRIDRLQQLTDATESVLADATAKAERLAAPGRKELLSRGWEGGSGSLGQRLEASRLLIDESRSRLDRAIAAQDLQLATEAQESAHAARELLDSALVDADRFAGQAAAESLERSIRANDVRALAGRVDELMRARSPLPPNLRGRRQQLESLISIAQALPSTATLDQIEGLEQRLNSFKRDLERAKSPPPGKLRSGAIAYLRGDYEAVLERLDEITYRDAKALGHSLLLRSAAAFALHVAGGEDTVALLERARADASAAKAALPDLEPAARAFSPRYRRFFDSVAVPEPEEPDQTES